MKDSRIERAIGICKKVVGAFSYSWKKKRALADAQAELNLPSHQMITESPTRWGSRQKMIERVLEQEKAISQVLGADKKTRHLVPTWQDIDVLESVSKALSPLMEFTDALSGEEYVSVSYLKPVLHIFNTSVLAPEEEDTDLTKAIKTEVLDYLNAKYSDPSTDSLLDMASLVDPRFKARYIRDDKVEEITTRAVTELESLLTEQSRSTAGAAGSTLQAEAGAPDTEPVAAKKAKKTLGSFFKKETTPSGQGLPIKEAIEMELKSYLLTPEADSETDPLGWWKIHEFNFPRVSSLAKKYLCIPATSSPSERAFSTGGNIVTCHRSQLKPVSVDRLVFLAHNL